MASIQKINKGYRAQIKKLGVRDSQLFSTKREAIAWANEREQQIADNATKPASQLYTLRQALRRYSKEVTIKKRGFKNEQNRIAAFESCLLPLDTLISKITPQDMANFRDSRLKTVSPGSVIRELNILSALFTTAIREWGWAETNPCRQVTRPPAPKHRERTINWREIKIMLRHMNYSRKPMSKTQATAICFLTALATGMRLGELCNLTWSRVHDKHVHLDKTKNGNSRDVPLSRRAKRYIECMRGFDDATVFGSNADVMGSLFRKYRKEAGLDGFTFHDARHTAATLISKRVDVLTLCKIFGWSNTSQALTYYNPSASSIADLLG